MIGEGKVDANAAASTQVLTTDKTLPIATEEVQKRNIIGVIQIVSSPFLTLGFTWRRDCNSTMLHTDKQGRRRGF